MNERELHDERHEDWRAKKGTPNKATPFKQEILSRMSQRMSEKPAVSPMQFFMDILADPESPYSEKKFAAKELLPYCCAKLSSVEVSQSTKSHEQRLAELTEMMGGDEPKPLIELSPSDIKH